MNCPKCNGLCKRVHSYGSRDHHQLFRKYECNHCGCTFQTVRKPGMLEGSITKELYDWPEVTRRWEDLGLAKDAFR